MTEFDDFDTPAPEVEAMVRAALRVDGSMPDDVWARLAGALAAEEPLPADAGPDEPEAPSAEVIPLRRRRWIPAAVAASVVLVAVGVLTPVLRGNPTAAPVAASARQALAESAAPLMASDAAGAPMSKAAGAEMSVPAMQVLASKAGYHASTLREDVLRTLDSIDADNPRLLSQVQPDPTPTEGTTGFTATLAGEQACIDSLTGTPGSKALLIDRAEMDGQQVSVVVLMPEPTSSAFEVYVVPTDCPTSEPLAHLSIPVAGQSQ